jgi:hypothetical protein
VDEPIDYGFVDVKLPWKSKIGAEMNSWPYLSTLRPKRQWAAKYYIAPLGFLVNLMVVEDGVTETRVTR